MKFDKHTLLLYAVTDRAWTGRQTLYQQVEAALKGGVTCVQLREKELGVDEFLQEAKALRKLCHRYHVPLIINDNVRVALAVQADGIHVGQEDQNAAKVRQQIGEEMILGVSVHNVPEALAAMEDGADYLGLGAVFSTDTKKDADWMDPDTLQAICEAVDLPAVAIGGIHENNIWQLNGSGVDGAAVVSAIFSADDIEQTCRRLKKKALEMVASCE